ncbi:MAG: hypothetical protein AAF465_15865 [Pseudomonadota bacterium]
MRLLFFLILPLLTSCVAPMNGMQSPDASQLIGVWKVDLRPTPESDAYFSELVITMVNERTFSGTFYGTPVTQARINTDWFQVRIAFVTKDGSGAYHHSAVLSGATLEGLSNSVGRDFLSYWSAEKDEGLK